MKILINASNLKAGGGLQVADSICREIGRFPNHEFIVVLSSFLTNSKEIVSNFSNVTVIEYNIRNNFSTIIMGRDNFLDNLVEKNSVEIVLTIFGPSRWNPRVPHLSGFAMAQLVVPDSPYYLRMKYLERLKSWIWNLSRRKMFERSTKYFYTENPFITDRVKRLFKGSCVKTVTNYYNQVFDHPEYCHDMPLPLFDGTSMLTITNNYPHKNLEIAIEIAFILRRLHPKFKFRFVITIDEEQFPTLDDKIRDCFLFVGKVDISVCPSLYKQSDISFQPTLIECFTATYPEAMRMERPIVTTDLEFARGLCGEAACYYNAVDAGAAAEAIYRVATDKQFANELVNKGKEQLKKFDNYGQRADKLIEILEQIVDES